MNKKTILMERLDKYCKQLGCSTPKIIWTKSDFMKVINETPSLKKHKGLASRNIRSLLSRRGISLHSISKTCEVKGFRSYYKT